MATLVTCWLGISREKGYRFVFWISLLSPNTHCFYFSLKLAIFLYCFSLVVKSVATWNPILPILSLISANFWPWDFSSTFKPSSYFWNLPQSFLLYWSVLEMITARDLHVMTCFPQYLHPWFVMFVTVSSQFLVVC